MIRLDQALFSFGGKPILDRVDLLIPEGACAGLIGRNGAGKTTFFRILLGEIPLDAGSVSVPRQAQVAFLPQHPALPADETILRHVLESQPALRDLEDDLLRTERRMAEEPDPGKLDRLVERHRSLSRQFEARGGYDLEARVVGALTGLGFRRDDLLRDIGRLSPGEKNRVALAKVLLCGAEVLLLDEPTNHLDFDMLEWLEGFLRDPPPSDSRRPVTAVVASHDRTFLNGFAETILELRDGKLEAYRGNYDAFVRQRTEELEREEKEYRLQQVEIAKDQEFIRRNFAAQKARQAKSREKRLARMEIVGAPRREEEGPRIRFDGVAKAGDDVLRARGIDCGYGERVLLRDVDLELRRGERVAIVGPNGCGKTTLLRAVIGELRPLRGEIHRGVRTVVGYYEQEVARHGSERSIFDEVHDIVPRWSDQAVRDLLAAFLFRGDEIFLPTAPLSGGEKARIALIRLILSGSNLLVLDEPTNHLDIYGRAALEESLQEFPETLLFVSHDRTFVERLATRVLAVHDGALREFVGGYEEYRETYRREEAAAEASRLEAREAARDKARADARARPTGRSREAEERRLLERITRTEEEIRRKQEECGLEVHFRNPESMRRLKRELAELEVQLAALYREWEALSG